MHFAYLDEFGHIGPYISADHPRHNTSPIFGLGGLILPSDKIRGFSTWFFQRKCEMLASEIEKSKKHRAEWEKKGSSLYTTKNIERYPELRHFTSRFLNQIDSIGGRIFYVGMRKDASDAKFDSQLLYRRVLRETIKRLNQYCAEDCDEVSRMMIVMDEHQERDAIVTEASREMYRRDHPQKHLIEPPFEVESHRYQTVQAADWVCGLVGRLEAYRADSKSFSQFAWAEQMFGQRIKQLQVRSSVRKDRPRPTGPSRSNSGGNEGL